MAERRMFAKTIVTSDAFLDMPMSARCLYFTLGMFADDDGFVNSPKSIMRQVGASMDDMNILLAKKFVISFESGVIVIKHWRINNYLRNDRYTETKYLGEKATLEIEENGAYSVKDEDWYTNGIPSIDKGSTGKISLGKDSLGESSYESYHESSRTKRFVKPTVEQIQGYCDERNNGIDAQYFYDYYEARGWLVGKAHMKDWKATVRTWERNGQSSAKANQKVDTTRDVLADLYWKYKAEEASGD